MSKWAEVWNSSEYRADKIINVVHEGKKHITAQIEFL